MQLLSAPVRSFRCVFPVSISINHNRLLHFTTMASEIARIKAHLSSLDEDFDNMEKGIRAVKADSDKVQSDVAELYQTMLHLQQSVQHIAGNLDRQHRELVGRMTELRNLAVDPFVGMKLEDCERKVDACLEQLQNLQPRNQHHSDTPPPPLEPDDDADNNTFVDEPLSAPAPVPLARPAEAAAEEKTHVALDHHVVVDRLDAESRAPDILAPAPAAAAATAIANTNRRKPKRHPLTAAAP